jgi:cytoskeletal protein RodZ
MAEAEDEDVLEVEKAEGESFVDKIKSKINGIEFTTTLIIKIVIGFLTVLLIVLAVYFFMPKEEAVEAVESDSEAVELETNTEETVDGANGAADNEAEEATEAAATLSAISGALEEEVEVISDASEAIAGDVATEEAPDLSLPVDELNIKDASEAEKAAPPVLEGVNLEIFKLQEQILMLEDENRRLKQRVNTLQAQANMSDEPKKTGSPKTRKSEQESMPQPTWGDFAPLHQGP